MTITTEYTFNSNVTISLSMLVNEVAGGDHCISILAEKNDKEMPILRSYYFYAAHPVIFAEPSNEDETLIIRIIERDENSHDYLLRIKVYNDIVYVSNGITVGAYPLEED